MATHRIDVGDDADVADALYPRLVVGVVTRVGPREPGEPGPGQLGVFQHQHGRWRHEGRQQQQPWAAWAMTAGAEGGATEHPRFLSEIQIKACKQQTGQNFSLAVQMSARPACQVKKIHSK
jgi:hypothetical protein